MEVQEATANTGKTVFGQLECALFPIIVARKVCFIRLKGVISICFNHFVRKRNTKKQLVPSIIMAHIHVGSNETLSPRLKR